MKPTVLFNKGIPLIIPFLLLLSFLQPLRGQDECPPVADLTFSNLFSLSDIGKDNNDVGYSGFQKQDGTYAVLSTTDLAIDSFVNVPSLQISHLQNIGLTNGAKIWDDQLPNQPRYMLPITCGERASYLVVGHEGKQENQFFLTEIEPSTTSTNSTIFLAEENAKGNHLALGDNGKHFAAVGRLDNQIFVALGRPCEDQIQGIIYRTEEKAIAHAVTEVKGLDKMQGTGPYYAITGQLGEGEVFLMIINSSGGIEYGSIGIYDIGESTSIGLGIVQTPNATISITGKYFDADNQQSNIFLLDIKPDASIANPLSVINWAYDHDIPDSKLETPNALLINEKGNYIIAGKGKEHSATPQPNVDEGIAFLMEIEAEGEKANWLHFYPELEGSSFEDVRLTEDGGYFSTGYAFTNTEEKPFYDIFTVKTDATGKIENCDCYNVIEIEPGKKIAPKYRFIETEPVSIENERGAFKASERLNAIEKPCYIQDCRPIACPTDTCIFLPPNVMETTIIFPPNENNCEHISIVYEPSLTSTFPCGTTTVTCTATNELTGEVSICTFDVTVKCQFDCNCDKIKDAIIVNKLTTNTDSCQYEIGVATEVYDCIRSAEWTSDFGFMSTDLRPGVITLPCGTHTLNLTVVLIDGTICTYSWQLECEPCEKECDCDKVKAGIIVNKLTTGTDSCQYELGVISELYNCIESAEWTSDFGFMSTDFRPGVITLPCGTHTLRLKVVLADSTICEYSWTLECEPCEEECDCDKVKAGIIVNKLTTSTDSCQYELGVISELYNCIESAEWTSDFGFMSTDFRPGIITLPCGTHTLNLKVVLADSTICEYSWTLECEPCEEECDCDKVKAGIIVNKLTTSTDSCQYELGVISELYNCIESAEWTSDFGFMSTDFRPGIITLPCGTHTLRLKVVLIDGTICEYSWTLECEPCEEECDCDKVKAGIIINKLTTSTDSCQYELGVISELYNCIESAEWTSDFGFMSTDFRPGIITLPCGTHTLMLKVVLIDGTICEYSWTLECEPCEEECDCDKVKAGIIVNKLTTSTDSCQYELGVISELYNCIESAEWTSDFGFMSTDFRPGIITLPCGTHTLRLKVVLIDGTICEYSWTLECEPCEEECDCDKVKAGIIVNKLTTSTDSCQYELGVISELYNCIESAEWTSDFGFMSTDFRPGIITLPCGTHTLNLKVVLADSTICEYSWTLECEPCEEECDCDKVKAGIIVNKLTTSTDSCRYELGVISELYNCIESAEWTSDFGFMSTDFRPGVITLPCGTHTLNLKVVLADSTICEYSWTLECEPCEEECDCDKIKTGATVNQIAAQSNGCEYEFSLATNLESCVESIEWFLDGVSISTDWIGGISVTPGIHTIKLSVILLNGEKCEIDFSINCGCPDIIIIKDTIEEDISIIATEEITAENVIEPGASVTYQAGQKIILRPGFHAKEGAIFHAFIETVDCPEEEFTEASKESVKNLNSQTFNEVIKSTEQAELALTIAPNPFRNQAMIDYFIPVQGQIELNLYHINGQLIEQIKATVNEKGWHQLTYQSNNIQPGAYYLILKTEQSLISKKVIIH